MESVWRRRRRPRCRTGGAEVAPLLGRWFERYAADLPFSGRRPARRRGPGLRDRVAGGLLLVLPLPLLLKAVIALWTGDVVTLAAAVTGYVLFALAAFSTRRGFIAARAALDRPLSAGRHRRWKAIGGALAALAAGFVAFTLVGHGILAAAAYAIGTALAYFMVYGGDGDAAAALPGWARRQADADAREILAAAYARLDGLEAAAVQIGNREFQDRLGNITLTVGKILKLLEADPADLRRSRKFLNVYLDGAHEVTQQYVRSVAHQPSAEREHSFRTLLVDIENTCDAQYDKLLQHDALNLDVQIEVLTTRLRREGVG